MTYVFLVISCIVFVELFIFFGILNDAMKLVTQSREAMNVVMSSKLDDDAKEIYFRRASIDMLKITLVLAKNFLLIAIVLFAMYWGLVTIRPDLKAPILESFTSPVALIGVTVAAMIYAWVRNAVRG